MMNASSHIAVLNFGSQYAHLIAKKLRSLGYYAEIFSPQSAVEELASACGLVLSGGPASVLSDDVPPFNQDLLSLDVPILGLCYGHQLISKYFQGQVSAKTSGEYGKTTLDIIADSPLFEGFQINQSLEVWASHQDSVSQPPKDFKVVAQTDDCSYAALAHQHKPIYTMQFHPEVSDTPQGHLMLENFAKLCNASPSWSMAQFVENAIEQIRQQAQGKKVLMFLSGGVDSSVAYALIHKALGDDRVMGLFIDNGFLRLNEAQQVLESYKKLGVHSVLFQDDEQRFLGAVQGISDPQQKRHAIGETFLKTREEFLKKLELNPDEWLLGQGTLYPDVIESGGVEHSHTIKSHHNRVQAVEDLIALGHVVEPLQFLYKDEVRQVGSVLGLPDSIVWRHPFPGPGLAINVLCSQTQGRPDHVEKRQEQLQTAKPDEYQISMLPVRSVGVQGDRRTYECPAVLSKDLNTTSDLDIPWDDLEEHSIALTNRFAFVNRVVFLLAPSVLPVMQLKKAYCTKERLDLLRKAEALTTQAFQDYDLMQKVFQILVILLPLSSDGIKESLVLRPVCSQDVMTARFAKIPQSLLDELVPKLLKLPQIEAVFYDITHKPPATFGWE